MDAFIKKGFYTIGALKTNRILYPCGIKQKVSEFALHLRKTDAVVSLVTVGRWSYYVYRYEGSLNGIDNAIVLISYPKDAFIKRDPEVLAADVADTLGCMYWRKPCPLRMDVAISIAILKKNGFVSSTNVGKDTSALRMS